MILQALNEYYQRKSRLPDSNLAPPGFEHKAIPFFIVLTADGRFAGLDDTREGEGKKKIAKTYLVPQTVKRSSGVAANLLWDHSGYVFGVDNKGKPERVREQHLAFIETIRSRFAVSDDAGIQAVLSFLEHGNFESVFLHPLWPEIQETGANLTFRLQGDSEPVCERPAVVALSVTEKIDSEKLHYVWYRARKMRLNVCTLPSKGYGVRKALVPASFRSIWMLSAPMANRRVAMRRSENALFLPIPPRSIVYWQKIQGNVSRWVMHRRFSGRQHRGTQWKNCSPDGLANHPKIIPLSAPQQLQHC